jgi:hypothetical protein
VPTGPIRQKCQCDRQHLRHEHPGRQIPPLNVGKVGDVTESCLLDSLVADEFKLDNPETRNRGGRVNLKLADPTLKADVRGGYVRRAPRILNVLRCKLGAHHRVWRIDIKDSHTRLPKAPPHTTGTGERDGAAGGSGERVSRGVEGVHPRPSTRTVLYNSPRGVFNNIPEIS